METGEWVMRFEDLPLKAFLDRLASEYRDEAAAAGRQFSSAILLPEDLRVSADARLLERAFENLFTNALRYVPVGAGMHLQARIDGEGLILRFDDEGPGIAPEELPRIFEPYYRGSGDGRQDGLGLGLFIASSIIRGHGWSLEASSKPGEGAVFTISVPASGIRS
ncbi:MAG: sensor histidine kinase, partial [Rectinema sp.]